jgi:hypothetical protein
VDESNLTSDISFADPPNLPLAEHIHRLVTLKRSSRSLEFPKPLLGVYSTLDCSMVLFQDVVQVLYWPMSAAPPERSFLLYVWDRRTVDRCQIRVDDAGLRMTSVTQRLTKQPFGRIRVAQRRQQEIDGGTAGIDRPIQVTPAPFTRM